MILIIIWPNLYLVHEVLGAPGPPVASPAHAAAEEHVEEVGGRVEAAAAAAASAALLDALLAVAVVQLPLLRVGQHLVGHRYLLGGEWRIGFK